MKPSTYLLSLWVLWAFDDYKQHSSDSRARANKNSFMANKYISRERKRSQQLSRAHTFGAFPVQYSITRHVSCLAINLHRNTQARNIWGCFHLKFLQGIRKQPLPHPPTPVSIHSKTNNRDRECDPKVKKASARHVCVGHKNASLLMWHTTCVYVYGGCYSRDWENRRIFSWNRNVQFSIKIIDFSWKNVNSGK